MKLGMLMPTVVAIALLFLSACAGYMPGAPGGTAAQSCANVPTITTGSVTWSPQWCQEFNGPAGSPDTKAWVFDLGNNNGWGNNEVEVYCGPPGYPNNPSQCANTFSTSTNTVYIDGSGHLVIQPINNNGTWLSTRMKTQGKENFQYGLIEASLQIPDTTNQGLWPTFWSEGSDYPATPWPNSGEADFMENWSPQVHNGPGPLGNKSTIHTAKTGGPGIGKRYAFPPGAQANTGFHTYGVIWTANMMEFYVDNPSAPFFIVTPNDLPFGDTWPFNANIFLILSVAVGGTLGGSTASLTSPQPLMVDYIRWYTPSSGASPAILTPEIPLPPL
jgi:beta-glucanase (GH16 family)